MTTLRTTLASVLAVVLFAALAALAAAGPPAGNPAGGCGKEYEPPAGAPVRAARAPVRPAGTSVPGPPPRAHRVTSTAHPGISTARGGNGTPGPPNGCPAGRSVPVPAVSQHCRRAPACRSLAPRGRRARGRRPARSPRRRRRCSASSTAATTRARGDGPGSPSRAFAGIQLLLGRGVTPGRLELFTLSALAGLMALTLLSALWGIAGTEAIREAERCALYVVGLAALLVIAQPATIRALLNGVLGGAVVFAARSGSSIVPPRHPPWIRIRARFSRSPSVMRTPSDC